MTGAETMPAPIDIDPAPDDPCHLVHIPCERAACTGALTLTCESEAVNSAACGCGRAICAECVIALRAFAALNGGYGCPWCGDT